MSAPTANQGAENQGGESQGKGTDPGGHAGHQQHPRGLYTLFGAEAWERFSYYGMRALLVLYMTKHLKFERKDALAVYAFYTGLVYLTPIAGGWLADKLLGRRKAVLIGGIVMGLGQLTLSFEKLLYVGLGLLIIGNGFFKPNISTIVGGLYKDDDPRRDGGFTIFYMGINLGAFFSPLICGNLGENVGWKWGFGSAAIGMAFGLAQFTWGQKWLGRVGLPPRREIAKTGTPPYREGEHDEQGPSVLVGKDYLDVLIWVAGSVSLVLVVLKVGRIVAPAFAATPLAIKVAAALGALGVVFWQLYKGSTREEVQRVTVIIILCVFNIFFWMGFEQAGGTMTLFADKQTNREISGLGMMLIGLVIGAGAINIWNSTKTERSGRGLWIFLTGLFGLAAIVNMGWGGRLLAAGKTFLMPASQFQSINPLLIVVLAPTFSNMWERLDSNPRTKTSTPTKMSIGMVILGLGFVVMFLGQRLAANGPVSPLWLTAVYAIHTTGELCLSPIGLSMVTKLAPSRVVSLAMGLWFMSSFFANLAAGLLEGWLESFHVPIYGFLIFSSIGPAILLLALTPLLKKWMHGRA
ncbi:MAG: peptide MFS transporter [Deltaproteobacteria bacterium]|nr:peptide MFS transporter [Deltaproteobacteria bacterium]